MHVAFFGSSLVSTYWNGAATYYRGILRALHRRGHTVTFYEPDAYDRQKHIDFPDPPFARSVVYEPTADAMHRMLDDARDADLLVKASGVGVLDAELEAAVLGRRRPGRIVAFWDVDAPATLARLDADPADPFHGLIASYDLVLTYGGGPRVVAAYTRRGAGRCVPVYNALDPDTHYPVAPEQSRFAADVALLANRLPDREERIRTFFFDAAAACPDRRFLLGGSGWPAAGDPDAPPINVRTLGHVPGHDHNVFNCTPGLILNVHRRDMVACGYSPATRLFEAAGAGACMITDAFEGIEAFLEPGREIFVADDADGVARVVRDTDRHTRRRVGEAARRRVLADHTYDRRALDVEAAVRGAA